MKRLSEEEIIWLQSNLEKSITEICKHLNRGKSTIHYWLSKYSEERMATSAERQNLGRSKGGKVRSLKRANAATELATRIFHSNKDDVDFMVGLSLYWAEGAKRKFEFTNGDPSMIRFFTRWIEKYFSECTMSLYIYAPLEDRKLSEEYWRNKVNQSSYKKILLINQSVNTRLQYGIAHIAVSGTSAANILIQTLLNLMREHLKES